MVINEKFELLFWQFPKDSEEERLAIRIATLFTEDLCQLGLDDLRFSLVITERDLSKEEMTSKLEIRRIGEHESVPERPLFKTVAKQYYHAHVPGQPWEDYCGEIEISLKLEGVLGQADQAVKHPLTDVLTMLAYGHYYQAISLFYSEWETSYLDAPVCNDAQLVSDFSWSA